MAKSSPKGTRGRRKKVREPTGLTATEVVSKPPREVEELCRAIEEDGGKVVAPYRDPLGGRWLILAALPLEQVEPTPYQRGLSDTHVKRLTDVISRTGRYLDPVIAFRAGEKKYQTPNGHHRVSALKMLGARSVTALVVTEPEVARLILALNVEKAHNLREKCQEALRLARDLAKIPSAKEDDFSLEFEEPAFLTLGISYEKRPRFAGGAYHPTLRRVEEFLPLSLEKSLAKREGFADSLLAIDDRVSEIVTGLRERGFESPYLRNFVVARINPLRFRRGAKMPLEELLQSMSRAAEKFDPDKVKIEDLARSGGAPEGEPGS